MYALSALKVLPFVSHSTLAVFHISSNYPSAGFYPIKCALGLSFYEQSTLTVLLPLCLLLTLGLLSLLHGCVFQRNMAAAAATFKENLVTCTVLVVYLLYPSVVETVLTVFLCHSPVEGVQYLSADLTLTCYDGKHWVALLCSTAVLVVYALGLPAFILVKLRPQKDPPRQQQRVQQPVQGSDGVVGEARPEGEEESRADDEDGGLLFLLEGYDRRLYPYWEAVIMLRKLALQCIAVLLSDVFVQGATPSLSH